MKTVQYEGRILVAAMFLLTFLLSVSPAAFAQAMGPGAGAGNRSASSFSGQGVVVSTDPVGLTMVVTLNTGSRLFAQQSDFGKDVTLQVSKTAVIRSFGITTAGSGMVLLAPGSKVGQAPGQGGAIGAGKKLLFTDIQPGDAVFVSGTYNSTSGQFSVNGILDWIY